MRYLKLHRINDDTEIYLAADAVVSLEGHYDSTWIGLSNGTEYRVKESIKQILELKRTNTLF